MSVIPRGTLAELSVKQPAAPPRRGNLFAGVLSVISKPGRRRPVDPYLLFGFLTKF
jgi:hypothetical protein